MRLLREEDIIKTVDKHTKADIKGQKKELDQSRIDKVDNIEKILNEVLQKSLERSKRALNPNKYNPDGTINKKNKGQ